MTKRLVDGKVETVSDQSLSKWMSELVHSFEVQEKRIIRLLVALEDIRVEVLALEDSMSEEDKEIVQELKSYYTKYNALRVI